MIRGFDVLQPIGGLAPQIARDGYQFVGRYLKNLGSEEIADLSDAGIYIVSIWERGGGRDAFSAAQGVLDGNGARQAAIDLDQPRGSVIVSAIDYDASDVDWTNIGGYFAAFTTALRGEYLAGAYGNGLILGRLWDARLIRLAYLAGAAGWNGSRGFNRWNIRQHPKIVDPNLKIEIDPCDALDTTGMWKLPVMSPLMVPSALDLQKALNAQGANLSEDGVWGPRSAAALAAYYAGRTTWRPTD